MLRSASPNTIGVCMIRELTMAPSVPTPLAYVCELTMATSVDLRTALPSRVLATAAVGLSLKVHEPEHNFWDRCRRPVMIGTSNLRPVYSVSWRIYLYRYPRKEMRTHTSCQRRRFCSFLWRWWWCSLQARWWMPKIAQE